MDSSNLEELLEIGGKTNSLGKVNVVIEKVLANKALLSELYSCIKSPDPWVRMRAADAFEKVCRVHPQWIEPYVDIIQKELSGSEQQASIKWHLAELYAQIELDDTQRQAALKWLTIQLASTDTDWIVAVNCMKTLAHFLAQGQFTHTAFHELLEIQKSHKSKTVARKAHDFSQKIAD